MTIIIILLNLALDSAGNFIKKFTFTYNIFFIKTCPSVHAGALLYMDIILTASKLLRKAQYIVCSPVLSLGCEIN